MSKFLSTVFCAFFAVSLVAGGAQAATIYKKDGFTYKLSGDLQIQLRQKNGTDKDEEGNDIDYDLDVEYDDLEIKNAVSYELNNNMKAFGNLDFGFGGKDGDEAELEEAYVGLQFYTVKVLMGNTGTAADDFGIYDGLESYGADDAFDAEGNTSSDDLIMVKGSFDNFNVVISTDLEVQDDRSSYEVYADYSVSGFTIGAGYQVFDTGVVGADDIDIMGVSAAYSMDMFTVAADYSIADDGSNDYSVINIGASAKVDAFTVGVGYKIEDDDAAADEIAGYYANLQYKFPAAKNVKLFTEIGGTDEEDNDDLGYLAGLQVKF